MKKYLNRHKEHLWFIFIFTLIFVFIKLSFLYVLPFIIGISVSLLMYPIYRFMKKRLSFKPAFSATVITLFIFSVFITFASFILYLLIKEAISLYKNNIELFRFYFRDVDLISAIEEFNINSDMVSKISDTAFSVVRIVPITVTLLIVSFVSSVCFINNLPALKRGIVNRLSDVNAERFENFITHSRDISKKFIRSYILLYTLTFIESLFVFILIDVDYTLVFAFLAAVSDALPVFGPGAVYIPIAVVRFVSGDYLSSLTLVIYWGIVVIIRQIIEPKLLSDSIKIHPLLILSALYFSILSSDIWVLLYIMSLAICYKVLVESEVLSPLFSY